MVDLAKDSPIILGLEMGRGVCRGALVDRANHEVVAVAEVHIADDPSDSSGFVDPGVAGPALDDLLAHLRVADRSQLAVGMSIGPRHAGVGSGPSMAKWLESQAVALQQGLVCAGGLGVAFMPVRAVDMAVKAGFDVGLELSRVDFAPVAGARAIGAQVDDLICVGSGRGWQARMRDFEVLEAGENQRVPSDHTLTIVGAAGTSGIDRYGWIELSAYLQEQPGMDVGRYAVAVGAAIGVLYDSPANLLEGQVIDGRAESLHRSPARPPTSGDGGRAESVRPVQTSQPVRHEATLQLATARIEEQSTPERAATETRQLARAGARMGGSEMVGAHSHPVEMVGAHSHPVEVDEWSEQGQVHPDDPISMFSPENDAENILGTRNHRFGLVQILGFLAVVAAIAGAVYYFYFL